MKVCAIMATCGRHKLAKRSLRFFLDQDYVGDSVLLIYNNSDVALKDEYGGTTFALNGVKTGEQRVIIVNNGFDYKTGKPYRTLGAIYNDALTHVPEDIDIISHWDDDDIFLPNHISEGIGGLQRARWRSHINYKAYKPEQSYYRHAGGVQLMGNNLEPSVFVDANYLRSKGYSDTTSDQHLQWFKPLLESGEMFVDPNGVPTLIYNWGDGAEFPTFKTSGDQGNPRNFDNYRNFSKDHGDKVLTPWSKEDVQEYYDLVK